AKAAPRPREAIDPLFCRSPAGDALIKIKTSQYPPETETMIPRAVRLWAEKRRLDVPAGDLPACNRGCARRRCPFTSISFSEGAIISNFPSLSASRTPGHRTFASDPRNIHLASAADWNAAEGTLVRICRQRQLSAAGCGLRSRSISLRRYGPLPFA